MLAVFDGRGLVVALLHGLQHLLLAQRDLVVLEPRRSQYLAQDGQPFVQVFREQVQAHAALVLADAGVELRGQEGQALLQGFGGLRLRAAPRQQVAGQVRQALFAGGLQILTGVGIDDDVDQRQLAVRHHVGDRAALERDAELLRCRRLIVQRRVSSASPAGREWPPAPKAGAEAEASEQAGESDASPKAEARSPKEGRSPKSE